MNSHQYKHLCSQTHILYFPAESISCFCFIDEFCYIHSLVVSLHPDKHFVQSEFLLPSGTRGATAAAGTE